jgi:hypothetical protein
LVGAVITLDEVAQQLDAKKVEMAKRIRDLKLWEQAGFRSWEDCCTKVFGPKRTVNRHIAQMEEQGPDYFGISSIVRVGQSVYSLMDVQDGAIVFNGERIAITKANEERIKEIVAFYRAEAGKRQEDLKEKERALEKAKAERDNAKKAAQRLTEENRELKAAKNKPFPNCTAAQSALVMAQSRIVEAMTLVQSARNEEDFQDSDEAWIMALAEFAFKEITEACGTDPMTTAMLLKLDPKPPMERAGITSVGKAQ